MQLSITGKTLGARLNFTGYDAMASAMVQCSTHAQTLTVKDLALVAALRMATEYPGKTRARMW